MLYLTFNHGLNKSTIANRKDAQERRTSNCFKSNPDKEVKIYFHRFILPERVIKEKSKNFNLNFFPNPTTGMINVKSTDKANHNYKMEVYDLSGRSIMKQDLFIENGVTKFKLDAENGVYILYMYNENGTSIYRIMISK